MLKIVTYLTLGFVLLGCNTMLEHSTPSYSRGSMTKSKNEKGETVYRYQEPARHSNLISSPVSQKLSVSSGDDSYQRSSDINYYSQSPDLNLSGFFFDLDFAGDSDNTHFGMHGGKDIYNKIILARVGLSFFYSDLSLYSGLDLSIRAQVPDLTVKPFVGLGTYIGDTKTCSPSQNNPNWSDCEKKFLYAGYTELGLKYKSFVTFYRSYNINRAGLSVPTDGFWGLGYTSSY